MKIAIAAVTAGILLVNMNVMSRAQSDLENAANDSAYAVQAGDIESARFLSGKFATGGESLPASSVAADFREAGAKELPVMSASKKLALEGDVPAVNPAVPAAPAAKEGRKGDFKDPGFLNSLTKAVLSPIVTPVDGVISGGTYGRDFGKERMGKTGAVIGAILGGVVGLAVGLVVGVVKTVINVVKAFIHLFNGRL